MTEVMAVARLCVFPWCANPNAHDPASGLRCISQQASAVIAPAGFSLCSSCCDNRPASFVRSRDTAALFMDTRIPVIVVIRLWVGQHPRVYRFSGRFGLTLFERPDVLAFTSGLDVVSRQRFPLSRTASILHSTWALPLLMTQRRSSGAVETVSCVAVETLRRVVVYTQPLSVQPRFYRFDAGEDSTVPPGLSLPGSFAALGGNDLVIFDTPGPVNGGIVNNMLTPGHFG
jgi:hypothetical protein